jgi:hypothetical protein
MAHRTDWLPCVKRSYVVLNVRQFGCSLTSQGLTLCRATRKGKNDKLLTDGRTLTLIMRRESESASLLTQNTAEWVYRQGQKYVVFVSPVRRRSGRVWIRVSLISRWRNKEKFCLDFVHILTWFSQTRESLCVSVNVRPSVCLIYNLHKIIRFRIGRFWWEFIGFVAICFRFGF